MRTSWANSLALPPSAVLERAASRKPSKVNQPGILEPALQADLRLIEAMTAILTMSAIVVVLLITILLVIVTHSPWAYLIAAVVSLTISAVGLLIDPTVDIALLFGLPLVSALGAVASVRRGKWRYKLPDPERCLEPASMHDAGLTLGLQSRSQASAFGCPIAKNPPMFPSQGSHYAVGKLSGNFTLLVSD